MRRLIRFLALGIVLIAIAAFLSSVTLREAIAQTIRATLIKNIDEPGRTPYQVFLQSARGEANCGTNYCSFLLPAVPANKRLVITNVSYSIPLDATAIVQRLRLFLQNASYDIVSQLTLPYVPNPYPQDSISSGSPRRCVASEQVRWYVEAGQQPYLDFHTSGGGLDANGWKSQFLITGYMIDLAL